MEEKALKAKREQPQTVRNILGEDFDFKWDGVDYTLEKGDTQTYPFYLAEHCALHMARKYAVDKKLNFHNEAGKIVDDIMNKEFIDYDKLTIAKAKEIAKSRKISLEDESGKAKDKKTLIKELKESH